MNTPQLFHTMSREERQSGYRVSDSEVVDAIRVLQMYAEQVKDERTKLYFDAKGSNKEAHANIHLKSYNAARYMELAANDMMKYYKDTK